MQNHGDDDDGGLTNLSDIDYMPAGRASVRSGPGKAGTR
jgi:hypothetical protein